MIFAPRAPVEQASTARGARNSVPKKVRLREEPPIALCLGTERPPKLDTTHPAPRPQNPASAVHRLPAKNPKCEKRPPPSVHHHLQPTWLLAISGPAHPPRAQVHHAHSSLGKLADARSCRAKKMLQQRPRACCLDLAISPPMLMALCFCLASADHICLVRHRTIITDFAYVLADVVCSTSCLA